MNITECDIDRFTCGDCHILAKRLSKIADLPIHTFSINGKLTLHAFVIVRGKALDIEGLQNLNKFKYKWSKGYTKDDDIHISDPLTINYVNQNWRPAGCSFGRYSYERAREIADYFLEKYCI